MPDALSLYPDFVRSSCRRDSNDGRLRDKRRKSAEYFSQVVKFPRSAAITKRRPPLDPAGHLDPNAPGFARNLHDTPGEGPVKAL
jgi:hypothetical protein